jgi:hypothetical protein
MKTCYIIIFDKIENKTNKAELVEAIRSSYISKQGKENMFLIIIENKTKTKDIFELINSKINFKAEILVSEFTNFYGHFLNAEVNDWIMSQFPDKEWIGGHVEK